MWESNKEILLTGENQMITTENSAEEYSHRTMTPSLASTTSSSSSSSSSSSMATFPDISPSMAYKLLDATLPMLSNSNHSISSLLSLPNKRTRKFNSYHQEEDKNEKTEKSSDRVANAKKKKKINLTAIEERSGDGGFNIDSKGKNNNRKDQRNIEHLHEDDDDDDNPGDGDDDYDNENIWIEYNNNFYMEEVSDEDFTSGLGSSSSPTSSSFSCDSSHDNDYCNDSDNFSAHDYSFDDCKDLNNSIESTDFLLFPISDFNMNSDLCLADIFRFDDGRIDENEKDKDKDENDQDRLLTIKLPVNAWKRRAESRNDTDESEYINRNQLDIESSPAIEVVEEETADASSFVFGKQGQITKERQVGNQNVVDEKEEYEEDDEDEDEDYSYSRKNDEKTRFSIDEIQADLKEYTMRIAQEYGIFINED